MRREELDRTVSGLFGAARDECPAPEVRQAARKRVRDAAARAARPPWQWQIGIAIAATVFGAGLVLALLPREPAAELSPDPAVALPSVPRAMTSNQPAVAPPRSPTPSTHAGSARRTAPASPPTLEEELTLLRDVRSALDAGDSRSALRQLNRYDARGRRLHAEATMLRIEALSRADRADEAAALAQRFVATNPTNPLVDRARTFIPKTTNAEP